MFGVHIGCVADIAVTVMGIVVTVTCSYSYTAVKVDRDKPMQSASADLRLLCCCTADLLFCCYACSYINTAVEVDTDKPVLVDKYLDRAVELDVDALCDQEGNIVICGIMEHIEQVRGPIQVSSANGETSKFYHITVRPGEQHHHLRHHGAH
jgi:hypothetical protein